MAEVSSYKKDILNIFKMDLPLDKLSGCNILITGATGLIGGCLVETLMMNPKRDYHVYASGRNEERAQKRFKGFFTDPSFHFIQYDVMQPLTSDVNFDYIIHAASNASPNFFANNPVEVMKANIYGVSNLLDYGKEHGLKRFLYVSSGEVYGEGDGREFTEDYCGYVNITSPRSCYPSAKRAAETLCVSYAAEYGVDVVIARPCHVYGPYFTESDNRVYAQFIRNVLRGEDIVMKSTGEQYRSWCYVVDCISGLLFVLLKGMSREAYNIADKTSTITIKELAEMIAIIGGKRVVIETPSNLEVVGYNVVTKSVLSTQKLCALGWKIDGNMYDKFFTTINQIICKL
jgi:nucleoside-diphosphate-sugar epimerase